jgi:hypothetical protein
LTKINHIPFINILRAIICTIFPLASFGQFVNDPPLYSRKIHVSVREFQELMKTTGEHENPLETLEALLEVIYTAGCFYAP